MMYGSLVRNEEEWAACWAVALAEKDRELEVCAYVSVSVCVCTLNKPYYPVDM
jgi:hypothetical protein